MHYSKGGMLSLEPYSQTSQVSEKTLNGLCCCTRWPYALLSFHCLSCEDELKLINDCASFCVCFSIIHLLLLTTTVIAQVLFFEIQTFLGGAILMLFSIFSSNNLFVH